MIRSFRHKGLEKFFMTGSRAGIRPEHSRRLNDQLSALNSSGSPEHMRVPGWDLHELKGALAGHWAVKVSANWRLTFAFEGADAVLVDYQDYH
jgi:toxin HigB-1